MYSKGNVGQEENKIIRQDGKLDQLPDSRECDRDNILYPYSWLLRGKFGNINLIPDICIVEKETPYAYSIIK